MKPYADTAEENKYVVLPVLKPLLSGVNQVLEIGSGTGQQIVYFAGQFPAVSWLASDLAENIPGIRQWIDEASLPNLELPVALDVAQAEWPVQSVDFVYSSNTLHIMSWQSVEKMFAGMGSILDRGSRACIYGPFSFSGRHVSKSNMEFDAMLKQRNPLSGVRDVDALTRLAEQNGIRLEKTVPMPHNNFILIWRK